MENIITTTKPRLSESELRSRPASNGVEFAVIKTGGKQYLVKEGDTIAIERLKGEHKVGDKVSFSEVLLKEKDSKITVGDSLKDAKIEAEITEIGRAKKISVVRYRAKSRYHKKNGHRQPFMKVKIGAIK